MPVGNKRTYGGKIYRKMYDLYPSNTIPESNPLPFLAVSNPMAFKRLQILKDELKKKGYSVRVDGLLIYARKE